MNRIDFDKKEFTANGTKYKIQPDKLTYARYCIYERFSISFSFGISFKEVFSRFKEIHEAATQGNNILGALDTISNISYNQMRSIEEHGKDRIPHMFKFLTLFCNKEDEDITDWSESLMKEKINDWEASDIPVEDFFLLASNAVEGYVKMVRQFQGLEETGQENPKEKKTFQQKLQERQSKQSGKQETDQSSDRQTI